MGRFFKRWGEDKSYDDDLSSPHSPSLLTHPVVRLLFFEQQFVDKARRWAWATQGPCSVPNNGTNWPPKWPSQLQAVAAYWHFKLMKRHRDEGTMPATTSLEQMFQFAMSEMQADAPEKVGW